MFRNIIGPTRIFSLNGKEMARTNPTHFNEKKEHFYLFSPFVWFEEPSQAAKQNLLLEIWFKGAMIVLQGSFRLAANLLQPVTVAFLQSKNRKFPIICSDLDLCNSRSDLWLVWTRFNSINDTKFYWIVRLANANNVLCWKYIFYI